MEKQRPHRRKESPRVYVLVPTRWGWAGALRSDRGLLRLALPRPSPQAALALLAPGPAREDAAAFGDLPQRLQELEQAGIVERRVHDRRPVLVEYSLTEKGRDLGPVVEALQRWGERWENTGAQASPGVPPRDTGGLPFHVSGRGRP